MLTVSKSWSAQIMEFLVHHNAKYHEISIGEVSSFKELLRIVLFDHYTTVRWTPVYYQVTIDRNHFKYVQQHYKRSIPSSNEMWWHSGRSNWSRDFSLGWAFFEKSLEAVYLIRALCQKTSQSHQLFSGFAELVAILSHFFHLRLEVLCNRIRFKFFPMLCSEVAHTLHETLAAFDFVLEALSRPFWIFVKGFAN